MKRMIRLVLLLVAPAAFSQEAARGGPPGAKGKEARPAPTHMLQITPAHRIEAVLITEFEFPDLAVEEWVAFAPRLPELTVQRKVSTSMEPAGTEQKELSHLERPILSARVPVTDEAMKKSFKIRLTYRADLYSRQLQPLRPGMRAPVVKDLSEVERKHALAATELINFEAQNFQDWLDKHSLRRRPKERDMEFALRVFQSISKNAGYEARQSLDRHAVNVCKVGKSDCGGLSVLFVAALRANAVPARVLVGRFARPGDKSKPAQIDQLKLDSYGGQHATAEFFAQGVGWIPADMAAGVMGNKTGASLYHFGRGLDGFLTLHIDEDLIVESSPHGRRNILVMQSPVAWPTKATGSFAGAKRKETWEVRKLR